MGSSYTYLWFHPVVLGLWHLLPGDVHLILAKLVWLDLLRPQISSTLLQTMGLALYHTLHMEANIKPTKISKLHFTFLRQLGNIFCTQLRTWLLIFQSKRCAFSRNSLSQAGEKISGSWHGIWGYSSQACTCTCECACTCVSSFLKGSLCSMRPISWRKWVMNLA